MIDANTTNDDTYQTIDQIWGRYDKDGSGELDKLETLNFLNEFLAMKGKQSVTIDQFNIFFKKFDLNGDGMIEKSEMARFVRQYIQGQAAVNLGADQAGGGKNDRLAELPLDKQVMELKQRNEQLLYRNGILEKTIKEGGSTVEDLEHLAYKVFNEDLRGRLKFVSHFFDWHAFGDRLTGNEKFWNMRNIQEMIGKKICEDGEFTDEHFSCSKSQLHRLMEKVYFPVITCKEHQGKNTKEDWAISNECEKFHDQILI